MDQRYESCSIPLKQVVCMSHILNYVIISLNIHTYRPTVLPASLIWTLWVLLCGAPNELTSHVEGINLRLQNESKTIHCKGVSQYMHVYRALKHGNKLGIYIMCEDSEDIGEDFIVPTESFLCDFWKTKYWINNRFMEKNYNWLIDSIWPIWKFWNIWFYYDVVWFWPYACHNFNHMNVKLFLLYMLLNAFLWPSVRLGQLPILIEHLWTDFAWMLRSMISLLQMLLTAKKRTTGRNLKTLPNFVKNICLETSTMIGMFFVP